MIEWCSKVIQSGPVGVFDREGAILFRHVQHRHTTREKFSRSYACESNALAMVHDLPYSISNILRTDFPDPSRISTKPRMFFAEPSRNQQYLYGTHNAHQKFPPAKRHQG